MAVEDKMIDIIVEQLSVDHEKVVPEASFVNATQIGRASCRERV